MFYYGTSRNDGTQLSSILGTATFDVMFGNNGEDWLNGSDGNDNIYGSNDQGVFFDDNAPDHLDGGIGNDNLYGGGGKDDLNGGRGDDHLYGENGDDYLYDDLGNDILDGGLGNDSLDGGPGFDMLIGGSGDDTLSTIDGDYLMGGSGNDVYNVDNIPVFIYETADSFDNDIVNASISFTLGDGIETLYLKGLQPINGTGNDLGNTIIGNNANNRLSGELGNDNLYGSGGQDTLIGGPGEDRLRGELGNDTLKGGAGADRFVFGYLNEGVDTIKDFKVVDDTIEIVGYGFGGGLTSGATITAEQFRRGSAARDASDRFIYNRNNGWSSAVIVGVGGAAQVHIATLSGMPSITNADIFVI